MDYRPNNLMIESIVPRPTLNDITIVIPTIGRPILEESLYWIASGSAWPGRLIVVDQSSNRQIATWINKFRAVGIKGAEYFPSNQLGRAAGVNRGLEQVKTRFVAITDDDCFVEYDWLRNMVNQLRKHPEAIITGRVEAIGDGVVMVVTSPKPVIYRRPRLKYDSMSGGNMGTSKTVIKQVGLFDEHASLRTAEDGEWAYRALRAGVTIVYSPEVGVRHFGWRNEEKRESQYRDYALSHGGFYGKYLRKGDWFIALRAIIHHLRALKRWVGGVVTRDREAVIHGRAYFTSLLPGIISGFNRE